MVYLLNANECYSGTSSLARRRNMLFTAITRSKAWVRVTGVGAEMGLLAEEFEATKDNDFELRFRYPTERERTELQIVHRDMTPEDELNIERQNRSTASLIQDLESGKLYPEDLDRTTRARLLRLLEDRDEW